VARWHALTVGSKTLPHRKNKNSGFSRKKPLEILLKGLFYWVPQSTPPNFFRKEKREEAS
jgi:hypothetical protein